MNATSGSGTVQTTAGATGTWKIDWAYMGVPCADGHRWRCESLRGSNKNQRVETVECRDCGRMERRVWLGQMNAPRPDRVHVLRESHGQTVTA